MKKATMDVVRVCWLGCMAAILAGGCSDSGETSRASNADTVNQLLTDEVAFEGATIIEAALPSTTNAQVRIEPVEQSVIVSPGQTSILALSVRSPTEDTDPIDTTLLQVGASPRHIEVPRAQARAADIENAFTVSEDICATLCRRTYTVTLVEAGRTMAGDVGAHGERTLTLDCGDADVPECSDTDEPTTTEDAGDGTGGAAWTAAMLSEIRSTAAESWQQAQDCASAPDDNVLANSAAGDLITIGVDAYSSDDFQGLGPGPIAGTWQSIAFSAGEEAMAVEAARSYGAEVSVSACGGTSLGIELQPDGARYVAALVWLECIQCGDVCVAPDSPTCQTAEP